jgi:uncharacterized protein DUF255
LAVSPVIAPTAQAEIITCHGVMILTKHLSIGLISLVAGAIALILILNYSPPRAQEAADMQSTNTEHKHTNHLIEENSPYLLSHAHNPVDWYP